MTFSQGCTDLITSVEGFSASPYVDPGTGAEPITQGYGSTFTCDGAKVTMSNPPWTKDYAVQQLLCYLDKVALPCLQESITSDINQNQLNALGSFVYNIGTDNFKSSTVLREVNINPSDPNIRSAIYMWNKGGGKVLNGLVARRIKEADLYFSNPT